MRRHLIVFLVAIFVLVGIPLSATFYYEHAGTPYYAKISRSQNTHQHTAVYQLHAYGANGHPQKITVDTRQHPHLHAGQFIKVLWTRHHGVKQYQLIDATEVPIPAYQSLHKLVN